MKVNADELVTGVLVGLTVLVAGAWMQSGRGVLWGPRGSPSGDSVGRGLFNLPSLSGGNKQDAPYPSIIPGIGGGYDGGSYFTPEAQRQWAVPDEQLPGWADL